MLKKKERPMMLSSRAAVGMLAFLAVAPFSAASSAVPMQYADPFALPPGQQSLEVLAQAVTPTPPDPAYAGIRMLRFSADLLSLPETAGQACGVDPVGIAAAAAAGVRNTGLRLIGRSRPEGMAETEWRNAPQVSFVVIAIQSPTSCDVVIQAMLTAPVMEARMSATGTLIPGAEIAIWTTNQARRSTPAGARAQMQDIVSGALAEIAEQVRRASSVPGAASPAAPVPRSPATASNTPSPAPAGVIQACPEHWRDLGTAAPASLACACPAAAMATNAPVWGTDVYTDDSSVCRAALHAGAISPAGGNVTVVREAGRPSYAGSNRNSVTSSNYGAWTGSFRFGASSASAPQKLPGAAR